MIRVADGADDEGDDDDNDEVTFLRQMLWKCHESNMISVDCSLCANNDIISRNWMHNDNVYGCH